MITTVPRNAGEIMYRVENQLYKFEFLYTIPLGDLYKEAKPVDQGVIIFTDT